MSRRRTVMLAYVVSRTIGLPHAEEDIGNWRKPLGLASLFVEGCIVSLSAGVLLSRRERRRVSEQDSDVIGPAEVELKTVGAQTVDEEG